MLPGAQRPDSAATGHSGLCQDVGEFDRPALRKGLQELPYFCLGDELIATGSGQDSCDGELSGPDLVEELSSGPP